MKMQTKLNYNAQFKTKVVFELLLNGMPLQKISEKYHISVSSITRWKKQLLGNASKIFGVKEGKSTRSPELLQLQQKNITLKEEILNIQNNMKNVSNQDQCTHIKYPHHKTSQCDVYHKKENYLPLSS